MEIRGENHFYVLRNVKRKNRFACEPCAYTEKMSLSYTSCSHPGARSAAVSHGENRFYVLRKVKRKNRFALRAYPERRSGATPKQVASNLAHTVRQYPRGKNRRAPYERMQNITKAFTHIGLIRSSKQHMRTYLGSECRILRSGPCGR